MSGKLILNQRNMKPAMNERYVYGMHAVTALLVNQRPVRMLYMKQDRTDRRIENILTLAEQQGVPITPLSIEKMNQRFTEAAHQGVVAVAGALPDYTQRDIPNLLSNCSKPPFILVLDGVTDPHNLGACLRSADGAGVDFVIIPKDKNAGVTPIVSKIACGAAELMPLVRVTNLVRSLELLKAAGVWVYGAAGEASASLYQLDCQGPVALVLGAEGQGMRRLTRAHCDDLYSLPMLGSVSSLNVSVAAGISLYEAVRQRHPLGQIHE